MAAKHGPLLVIVGETGTGKSALGLELATRLNGEIICADSWTVRRELNIGTAKPSQKDRKLVPHHLLDVVGPCEDFTAAVFKRLALKTMDDITGRRKIPIMVGGTGLYIDGVIFDFGFLPPGDREARKQLGKLSVKELRELIKERGLDETGLDVGNKRRLIRLIETSGAKPSRQPMRPDTLIIGIKMAREKLRQRIIQRTERMLGQGLKQEVHSLADQYGWNCEALKGIGYQEWQPYFEGRQTLNETKDRIVKSTLDLAKRQRTWFKRNPYIRWVDGPEEAYKLISKLPPVVD